MLSFKDRLALHKRKADHNQEEPTRLSSAKERAIHHGEENGVAIHRGEENGGCVDSSNVPSEFVSDQDQAQLQTQDRVVSHTQST